MIKSLLIYTKKTAVPGFGARRFLLLLPMLVWIAGSAFAQTTWTGGIDNAWQKSGNWSAGVPDATDDVIIPDVANDPVIAGGIGALAQSVLIQANALLTINATGSLAINGSAAYTTPFTFNFTAGLNNLGTVNNSGNITLGSVSSVGTYGIVNQGTFTNNTGGAIHIDNSTDTGLFNAFGTFTNAAIIGIGANTNVGLNGIWNEATFNNNPGGTIQIDRSSVRGLMNNADESKSISATFANSATITIGATETVGKTGLQNLATFTNNTGGSINIDRTSDNGLYHASGSFTNVADITIGAVASVGTYGLSSWSTFNNNTGGHIWIDRATDFGVYHTSGTFTNAAAIIIGGVDSGGKTGLENQAIFNNNTGGLIQIDRTGNLGFHHASGTFTNEADITIGSVESVGKYGFWSRATFNNNTGGTIRIDHVTTLSGGVGMNQTAGIFSNSGAITIGGVANGGYTGLEVQATFTNNTDGTINIDRTNLFACDIAAASTFTNVGSITIGAVAAVGNRGLVNSGSFNNSPGGHIRIDRTTVVALYSQATFTNSATITIGASTTVGVNGILLNSGNFRNSPGGIISIDRSSSIAIVNLRGTFNNDADITIGGAESAGTYGISNQNVFNNNTGGHIRIDRSTDTGIYQLKGAFTNSATITIGASENVGVHGIFNESTFLNNAGGDINIDRTTLAGLRNFNGTFTNEAAIAIGAMAGVGTYGIYNQAVFNNNAGGNIRIDRSTDTGLNNPTGTITNSSTITIGATAGVGFYGLVNNGNFNNNTGGRIQIDRSTDTGLYHAAGSFTNTAGITIGATAGVGSHGIFNGSTFTNNTGGDIHIDRSTLAGLRNFTGTFTNAAGITIGSTASVGSYGIYNQVVFANQTTGQINVNNAGVGIYLQDNTVANTGTVTIGALQNVTTLLTQQGAGNFSNNTAGTFKGTGNIAALTFTNAGGTLSPGYSPGKLTFNESKDFSNSIMDIEVNGTATAGVNFDQIDVGGTATLGGTLAVSINYTPVSGDEVTILTAQAISGMFTSVTGLPANWNVVYTSTSVKLVYGGASPGPTLTGFSASSVSVCVGSPITFTALVGNVTGSYAYTLTNGTSTTSGTTPSLTFNQSLTAVETGNQSFTLTISSDGQSTASATSLWVNALPIASLQASATLTCAVSSVTLTAGGGTSYAFAGPGILSQDATAGIAIVDAEGPYSVTVTNAAGCLSSTNVLVVRDGTAPIVNINPTSATLTCASPTTTLTASGTGNYLWNTGATSQTITVGTTGTYSVTLTGANGCSSTATAGVSTDQTTPLLSIIASHTLLTCSNPVASLTAVGSGSVLWSNGSTDAQISVNTASTYSVTLTAPGGCSASASITLSADNTVPTVHITSTSTTLTCSSPSVSLTAVGTGTVLWSTGSTTPIISASVATTYSVTLTAPNGCMATSSVTISQDNTPPTVSINPTSATLTCASPSTTLTASGEGSFLWSTGVSSSTISVSAANIYSVTLTSPSGCTASASTSISADQSAPSLSISPSSATLTCASPTATLTALGTGTLLWSTSSTEPQITVSSAGVYSVTLTSPTGCTASTSIIVSQQPDQTITITQQPLSATTVFVGSSVSVAVEIIGQPTAYQWYKDNLSNPLPNQTGAQLALANVQLSDAGSYSVVITGACNSLTSNAFALSVTNPVAPLSLTLAASPNPIPTDQATTLTATVAGGTMPYSYSFTGAGSITPSVNTASVSGLPVGVHSFTVLVTDNSQPGQQQVSGIVSVTVTAVETVPFAMTGVTTLACSPSTANRYSVTFMPQYVGQSGEPVSFSVVNELLPTTQPGPYTMQLYSDKPVITLQATQQGSSTSFVYHWLAACQSSQGPNTPPRLVTPIPNQTVRVNESVTFVIPSNTFTDSETPQGLVLSATGLPAGLSFAGATLSGTPSTTVGSPVSVTITATDPGGLSVSTQFTLTVLPASTPPDPTTPFAITSVTTISCTPVADRISLSFAPRYAGLNGQSIAFEVVNELVPTTNPAPYSLTLYRDNPTITLRAHQTGSAEVASFSYNWLAACSSAGQDNTPPWINSPVGSQTATVGQPFNLNLANVFADQETPNQVTLSATGLPAGLMLTGTAISGTPSVSGVSTVKLTATDGGGLTNTTSFVLTVVNSTSVGNPVGFAITGVQTLSCVTLSAGLRSVTFLPQYAGLTGQPISFRVENELVATTAAGPYTLNLYTDNPTITLKAAQSGSAGEASYSYNWLSACSAPARLGTGEPTSNLQLTLLGNPVEGEFVELEVKGVSGQWVDLQLVDQQGKQVHQHRIDQAHSLEYIKLPVGYRKGLLLLEVRTALEHRHLKVIVR
ncbi:putative Ig domain-containing protein [Spirosoma endbachense]|uniref:Ig-like domain-containing protein n=1 Tax=Spirosoma endbachense TaxID=2666025 RepID=A0A6P1W2B3_9BACT|nr:putative Ig domain-containing protein [Spirosoma endbachense]QHV99571.1 hypothetical protein GJR95_33195 [Spirosoma endbachense]